MSVDRDYQIRIKIDAEGSGAAQAADDLKSVGRAGEQAGEGLKFVETHGREFNRLAHEMDRIVPGVGLALRSAFNPAVLGIGALVLLFEQAKEALAEYNQKLDEAGEAAAKADFSASIEAVLEITRAAKEEQQHYIDNLHKIEEGEHGVAVELAHQLQLIAAIEAAHQSRADAEHTLALARVKEQEVSGGLSPTAAALQRQRIEDQYTRDKRAAEEQTFQEQQAARTKAATDATARQNDLEKKQRKAQDAYTKAQKDQADATNAIPDDKKMAAALKAVDDLTRKLNKQKGFWHQFWGTESGDPDNQHAIAETQAKLDAATAALATLNALKKRGEDAKNIPLAALADAAKQAREDAEANKKAGKDAEAARDQAEREHNATSSDRAATDKNTIEADARNTRTELIQRGRALQNKLLNHPSDMTRQEDAELLQLLRLIDQRIFEMGENAVTKEELRREVQQLTNKMNAKGK